MRKRLYQAAHLTLTGCLVWLSHFVLALSNRFWLFALAALFGGLLAVIRLLGTWLGMR